MGSGGAWMGFFPFGNSSTNCPGANSRYTSWVVPCSVVARKASLAPKAASYQRMLASKSATRKATWPKRTAGGAAVVIGALQRSSGLGMAPSGASQGASGIEAEVGRDGLEGVGDDADVLVQVDPQLGRAVDDVLAV